MGENDGHGRRVEQSLLSVLKNQYREHRLLALFLFGTLSLAASYFLFQAAAAGAGGPSPAAASINGPPSADLDAACQSAFGEAWDSQMWVADNPPTIICLGPHDQTGYVDMPVDAQRERNMVSTNQPNGTAQFILDDRTGPFNGSSS